VGAGARIVVTDANVVINLIHVGLLARVPAAVGMAFVVTDEVAAEVVVPAHRAALESVLADGTWMRLSLVSADEMAIFADLLPIMGAGEASSLALAQARNYLVASDERRAFRREARARVGETRIVDTPGLMVLAIRNGHMTVAEADGFKAVLETKRFVMRFTSFADVVNPAKAK